MRSSFASAALVLIVCLFVGSQTAPAAESATSLFPTEAAAWLNAPPLTPEMLAGKGVVL